MFLLSPIVSLLLLRLLLKRLWGRAGNPIWFWGVRGPLTAVFWLCFFFRTRSLGLVMNGDGPVLPLAARTETRGPMTELPPPPALLALY